MILAIDFGTTSWKAALISHEGDLVKTALIPTPVVTRDGFPCYAARELGRHLGALTAKLSPLPAVRLIALTGMAEAGLAVDKRDGTPLCELRPWFDRQALPIYQETRSDPRFSGRPEATGLPDSHKYGIYKLLTVLRRGRLPRDAVVWMSLQAYAAFLLTGECAEEPTVAARTGCLDLCSGDWDAPFLHSLGLSADSFPRLIPQGAAVGKTRTDGPCGLPAGIPVCLAGHDHLCAAWGVGAPQRGQAFISTGTAQVLLSAVSAPAPSTGLSYGPSPDQGLYACIGSIQSAGGSVTFWKDRLFRGEGYDALIREAGQAPYPTRLLYFPYLSGSGAPHLDPEASGMLLGLREDTSRGEMLAAVYEGIALETRCLAEAMGLAPGSGIACTGGLTLHPRYMQTLADVLGSAVCVPAIREATLYGAARLSARAAGIAAGIADLPVPAIRERYAPDMRTHDVWTRIYQQRYLPLMGLTGSEDLSHGI